MQASTGAGSGHPTVDAPARGGRSTPAGARTPARYVAIVQRGKEETFQILQKRFGNKDVEVIWDRRVGSRRTGYAGVVPERRRQERRARAPITWGALGFLLVWRPLPTGAPDRAALQAGIDTLRTLSEKLSHTAPPMTRAFHRPGAARP